MGSKKTHVLSLRLTPEELAYSKGVHEAYGGGLPYSEFIRLILLGDKLHPNFESDDYLSETIKSFDKSGPLTSSDDWVLHYLAMFLAVEISKIRFDKQTQSLIKKDPKFFQHLVDQMRGYEFDENNGIRTAIEMRDPSHVE